MAAYSNNGEKSAQHNNTIEMQYRPWTSRSPSIWSHNDDSTLYEDEDASPVARSPIPASRQMYPNHSARSSSRLALHRQGSDQYSPEETYHEQHFDKSHYDRSHYDRSPQPSSRTLTPNQANYSTSRLALNTRYVKQPVEVPKAQKFASDFTTFSTTYPDDAYTVEITGDRDDADLLSNWRRRLYRMSPLTTILSVGSYWAYFTLRILFTVYAQKKYHNTFIMAWFFISAEAIVAFPAIFHQLWQLTAIRGRKRKQLRIRGDIVPTVNVLVTCCKEDPDIVLDTVRAACSVDYPRDRFRVTVCDDGADPGLKVAVEYLKRSFPNVYYHARVKVKGVPHHFKAGNLIAATEFVAGLEGGPGEFLACLDADMIPEADWLRAIIPHLAVFPRAALSCPPQLFYNIPDNDPLVQSLDGFVHTMETVKDASGVAWCTGSGYAIRVAALESIGGWPLGSLAEDVCTSSMLLGRGWTTAYIHEPLQWGTVPDDLVSHLKQRTRWTLGTLQTAKKLNFFLGGKIIGNMTFFQRLSGFVFAIDAFFKVFFVISIMTFPVVLISGKTMVAYATTDQLRTQIRFCFAALALQRVNEYVMSLPSGYRQQQREGTSMPWMAPFHAMTVFRSFILPKWLGGKAVAFTSSGSLQSVLNERNPALRANVFRRLKVTLWDCNCWIHLLYILFVIAAVTLSTYHAFTTQTGANAILIYLLTHAAWPPLLWLITMVSFYTPLHYALFPPDMPDREETLDRNPKTGVAHPKGEWKRQRWNAFSWYYELQYSLLTAFTCLVFVGTFFIHNLPNNGQASTPGGPVKLPTPETPVTLNGQFQSVLSPQGDYTISTNQWGMDKSGAQSLLYDPNQSVSGQYTAFETTWSWLDRIDDVHSYPNVAPVTKNLPAKLADIESLAVDVAWTMGVGNTAGAATNEAALTASTVKANVAFDCFLDADSEKAIDPVDAGYEFMVWLAAFGGTQPLGYGQVPTPRQNETLGGTTFTLYQGKNSNKQTVLSWVADAMTPTFNADINVLLQDVVRQNLIPSNAYLGSVQFGTEATHSVGNTTFDASHVTMDLTMKS